jgi:hypothetical protein
VAGAKVRIVSGGVEVAAPTTDTAGHYAETLLRGSYEITVLPDGDYLPDGLAGCEIVASTCRLGLTRNRTVDFYGVNIEVPEVPPPAPPDSASPPAPNPGGGDESPRLRVNGVKVSRSGAVAQLQLTVPGPGVLTTSQARGGGSASASRRKKASSLLRTTRKRVRKAGRVKVTARLGKLGKRRLAKRGKVAVRVKVTYKPQRGKSFRLTKRIVFKKRGG